MKSHNHFIAHMTWDEIERRLANGAAALLPIGAGAKEHGRHLPMNTDEIQAGWLAARLAEKYDIIIWPGLRYGYYPVFTGFPGSISLGRERAGNQELTPSHKRLHCVRY